MARRRKGRPITGVVLVDKPAGMSSNAVLQKVRWLYQAQKAGHTGALDPAATGLLPICLGEATKFTQFLLDADKRYLARGQLGVETDTLDADGEIVRTADVGDISFTQLVGLIEKQFTGPIEQIPPMYSALKRDGKKLYELAREGKVVDLEPRPVTIYSNELLSLDRSVFELGVHCSKGTYIRTLVADIGSCLGCGAHVTQLRRTSHGKFLLDNAVSLDALIQMQEAGNVEGMDGLLISIDALLSELRAVTLDEKYTRLFSHGNDVQTSEKPAKVRVYGENHEFLGVGEVTENARLKPVRLVAHS
jgi:tRNA pseudouridine55 synthase